MPQYAYYDSTVASPSPILGWFDTDLLNYPNLPPQDNLLLMTSDQWTARLTGKWAVADGAVLVPYTPPVVPPTLAQQASAALNTGLTITSDGPTVTLSNVTFPVDTATTVKIGLVVTTVQASGNFPGGATEFPMKDMSGNWHTFTVPQYILVAGIISSYVSALNLIIDGNPLGATSLPFANVMVDS